MRDYPFITSGKILAELEEELIQEGLLEPGKKFIGKQTFRNLERRIEGFPQAKRNSVGWRKYTPEEKEQVKIT